MGKKGKASASGAVSAPAAVSGSAGQTAGPAKSAAGNTGATTKAGAPSSSSAMGTENQQSNKTNAGNIGAGNKGGHGAGTAKVGQGTGTGSATPSSAQSQQQQHQQQAAQPSQPTAPATMTLGQVLQGSWPFMAALVIVPSPLPPTTVGSPTLTPDSGPSPGGNASLGSQTPVTEESRGTSAGTTDQGTGTASPASATPSSGPAAGANPPPQSYSVSLDLNSTLLANTVIRHLFSRVFDRFPDPPPPPPPPPNQAGGTSTPTASPISVDQILADRPSLADTLANLVEATRTLFVDPGSPSRAKLASDMVEDQLLEEFYDPPPFLPDSFALSVSPAAEPSVTSDDLYSDSYEVEPPVDAPTAEFFCEMFFCVALWYLNGSFGREVDYALAVRWMAEGVRRFGLVKPEDGEWGWRGDEAILTLSHLAHHGIGCPPSLSLSSRLLSLLLPDNPLACYLLARSQEVYGQEVEYDMLSWGIERFRRQNPTEPDPTLGELTPAGGLSGHFVPTDLLYQLSSLGHFFPSLVRLACRSMDRRTLSARTPELNEMLVAGSWSTSRVPLFYALSLLNPIDPRHAQNGPEAAVPWLVASADAGNGRAAYMLGRIAEESGGPGLAGTDKEWYARSAGSGNPWGLAKLGCLLKSTESPRSNREGILERGPADRLMSAAWVNGFVVDPCMGMGMSMSHLPGADGKLASGQQQVGSPSWPGTSSPAPAPASQQQQQAAQPPPQSLHDLLLPSTYPYSPLSPTSLSLAAFSSTAPSPDQVAVSAPGAGTLPSVLDPIGHRWIRHLPLDPTDIGSYLVPFPSVTPTTSATEWLGTGVQSVEVGRGRARGGPGLPGGWLAGLVWGWGGMQHDGQAGNTQGQSDGLDGQDGEGTLDAEKGLRATARARASGALPSPSPIRKVASNSSLHGISSTSSANEIGDAAAMPAIQESPSTPVREKAQGEGDADNESTPKPATSLTNGDPNSLKPPLGPVILPQTPTTSTYGDSSSASIITITSDEEGTKKKTRLYRSPSHGRKGSMSTDDEAETIGALSKSNRGNKKMGPKAKQVLGKRSLNSRDASTAAGGSGGQGVGLGAAGWNGRPGGSGVAPTVNPHLQSALHLLSSLAFSTHYSTAPPNLSSPLDLSAQLPAPLLRAMPAQLPALVLNSPQPRTRTILTFAAARAEFLEAHRIALSFEDPVRSLYGYYRGFTTDPSAFRNAGIAECLVCAVVCFYASVYSSAPLHAEVVSGDGARSRKGGNPSAGGTAVPYLTGERKPYYGPEVGRMAETVLCYLMDTCAGWPAEYTLWKWENRTRVDVPKGQQQPLISPALELQRDSTRMDAETVFGASLMMKLGGWEKYRQAYTELGKVISRGASYLASEGDSQLVNKGRNGTANGGAAPLTPAEMERLMERERRLLPRYEALYLRGVCGLQLAGSADTLTTSPAGQGKAPMVVSTDGLREHPPLALMPVKKEVKAKQKEQEGYWTLAASDLEAYTREAGSDGKNGVDALYLMAYHRLSHDRDPKGFLDFFRAAQAAEPKRPPTWPSIQNTHLKTLLVAEHKYYEGTSGTGSGANGKMSGVQVNGGAAAAAAAAAAVPGLFVPSLRSVSWPIVDLVAADSAVRA